MFRGISESGSQYSFQFLAGFPKASLFIMFLKECLYISCGTKYDTLNLGLDCRLFCEKSR